MRGVQLKKNLEIKIEWQQLRQRRGQRRRRRRRRWQQRQRQVQRRLTVLMNWLQPQKQKMARKVDKKWTNRENIFMHNNGMIVTTNYDSQSDQMPN